MIPCEFILYSERPTGKGKDRVWPKCGQPSVYLWRPRPGVEVPCCSKHGLALAGNFKHELRANDPLRNLRTE